MIKRRKLGQHFLNSDKIAETIVREAKITKDDTVYEVGTGHGVITGLLCENAKKVISIDADKELFEKARNISRKNLTILCGDGFKRNVEFTIFVSNLPYSKSRLAIEWLAQTEFSHGVIMVQREFAGKILAGQSPRRAVSVIANHTLDITKISDVNKMNFEPPPTVDSTLLRICKKTTISKSLIQTINRMFSYRRKKVQNILRQFGMKTSIDGRLEDLTDMEIVNIAKTITEK